MIAFFVALMLGAVGHGSKPFTDRNAMEMVMPMDTNGPEDEDANGKLTFEEIRGRLLEVDEESCESIEEEAF